MEIAFQTKLEERVYRAAEAALVRQHYICLIDVLCGMRLLASSTVDSWRKGRIEFLESEIQGSPNKISSSIAIFLRWAQEKGLKPSETDYVRLAQSGNVPLRFFRNGDPQIEKIFCTYYVSSELSERKRQKLQERLEKAQQPVVFQNLRDPECSECGADIAQGSTLLMEGDQALCLHCARLDGLEFLPAGVTALTRRATKFSKRAAVVVPSTGLVSATSGKAFWWNGPRWRRPSRNAWRTPTSGQQRGHGLQCSVANRTANWLRK